MATQRENDDLARTPDQRMQYDEMRRREREREQEGGDRSGPSPYDQAPPGSPDDRVITKGKPEKPGPTSPQDLAGTDSGVAADDGMLQTNQVDRAERPAGSGGSMEEEELGNETAAHADLGGAGHHGRVSGQQFDEESLGDEESA